MAKNREIVLLALTIVIASICGICSAATYTVGDNTGWTIPSSASFYSSWASKQTFQVGDVLVFRFPVGGHTVAQVNKRNYDRCNIANTIGAVQTTSPANITLTTAGSHYFICTIPTHCTSNQKLSVVVTGPSTSPATSPTPSGGAATPATTPGGATSPSAEGPTTTTAAAAPPPPSSATSTGVGLFSLVFVAVAAFML